MRATRKPREPRKPREAGEARRYRRRRAAGCRIWRLELDEVNTEAFLDELGYLPEGYTRKEADAALAKFVSMVVIVSNDDMARNFQLRKFIEICESHKDALP